MAVAGASGVGKSTFGDEVARRLRARGHAVLRSTTDSFHRPRAERYKRGPTSPEGYYLDSHDLGTIERELLGPFSAGATRVLVAAFDEPADVPKISHVEVPDRSVLIFDGLFLLRPRVASWWRGCFCCCCRAAPPRAAGAWARRLAPMITGPEVL